MWPNHHRTWGAPWKGARVGRMVMPIAQDWRWPLASFLDAVKITCGCGDVALGFSLAGLVSSQAHFSRASGLEEAGACSLVARRKRLEAKGQDVKASGSWKALQPSLENGLIPCFVRLPDSLRTPTFAVGGQTSVWTMRPAAPARREARQSQVVKPRVLRRVRRLSRITRVPTTTIMGR